MKLRNLCLAAILVTGTSLSASVITYVVTMNGPSESPPNASPATGGATITIDNVANTLSLNMFFSGLTGTTTASHIHCCTAVPLAGTAGVATTTPFFTGFPIGVTSGTYNNTFDLTQASSYNSAFITANGGTTATAEAALLAGIASGEAYLNVHSSTFGGGEIRGFLIATPEPATLSLVGLALGGLLAFGRVRRRRA
jgi:CHRD domain-containing protein/PEP-CTERM motif-containing protein